MSHASSLSERERKQGEHAWSRWAHGGLDFWGIIKSAASGWLAHGAMEMAAAIAYYAAFSLAPLLVIVVAIAGLIFDTAKIRQQLADQFGSTMGKEGSKLIITLLENASKPNQGTVATIIGVAMLVVGATAVFSQLQESLNRTWNVREKSTGSGVWSMLHTRLISFAMILVIGFLLLISLVISAGLAGVSAWAHNLIPGWKVVLWVVNIVVSVGVVSVLFAMIFRFLPSAKIGWREVGIGAFITAVLFTLGKFLIGLYLGQTSPASVYGAAGSLAIILIWVYYSALIFLFGAEVTRAHAQHLGKAIQPTKNAELRDGKGPGSARPGGGESRAA